MANQVLLICGSYHQRSTNRVLLDFVSKALLSVAGVEVVESIGLDTLPCLRADFLEPAPSLVEEFRCQVSRSEGVVIAGPEYAGGIAGGLKNGLDWCVGSPEGFYQKPVLIMSAGTTGGPNAIRQLARTLLWQGAHLVGGLGVAAPLSKIDSTGELADMETIASLWELAHGLLSSIAMSTTERVALSKKVASSLGIENHPHPAT